MKSAALYAITLLVFCTSAQAIEATQHHDGPCGKIIEACKAAGYNKSTLKDNKRLSKDCMQPILNDIKVENVKIDDAIVKACKLKKAELKSKK